ncbi:MAG: DUF1631 domain-containing protein [Pseudomonadota bacterium]
MNRSSRQDTPYHQCARIFLRGMASLLQGMFESVDNALFEMAEKADSNALQTHYFDGMRQVRKTRSSVENEILKSLRASLISYQKDGGNSSTSSAPEISEDSLSLVEEAELEESLAISEMVAKGENRLSRPLFAIGQRLGEALNRTPPDDETNPLGPASICNALRQSGPLFEVELPVLLVIYKLFDRKVLEQLDGLYQQVNDRFVQDGVMPQLQRSLPSAGRGTPPPMPGGQAAGAADAPPADNPDVASPEEPGYAEAQVMGEDADDERIMHSILSLLSARRQRIPATDITGSAVGSASAIAQTQQLLNALSVLQNTAPTEAAASADVKTLLLSEMDRLDGAGTQASSDDEDTIDLVAMLFDFILSDENLPQPMQVLLSRLQIPYIKVALIDRQLFASRGHPARRLLDTLADLALGWTAEADRGNRLYDFMTGVVDRVINDFDDDLDLFDELRQELNTYVAKRQKRAQVAEKRTTEATEGKQRLQQARRTAARVIEEHLADQELPRIVEEILNKPWANVMVLTCLRHGEDSSQFAEAVGFVEQMVWSVAPKSDAAEVAKLQKVLPGLSAQLRAGLEMVAYHEDDVKDVFKNLKKLYQSMLDKQFREKVELAADEPPPSTMSLPAAVAPVQLPISGAAELSDGVFDDLDNEPEPVPLEQLEAALRSQVESLEPGTWFQFSTEDGGVQRAKLSWKSPITGNYLFVDQKGIKLADKPVAELAQELASGEAIALETVPLFDRALEAIAERLQETPAETES